MSDMMSQEEIEALLSMGNNDAPAPPQSDGASAASDVQSLLTDTEKDTLGEVGNICMGTAATTMYTLLGHRVDITTPRVSVYRPEDLLREYAAPYIAVEVQYTEGVLGNNLLLLREYDAAVITDLMMGGDGKVEMPIELSELHLSAISEVMNQMVGSSATSLSEMLHSVVNISPPTAQLVDLAATPSISTLDNIEIIIKISFQMEIEGLLNSELMQIMPLDFGKQLVQRLIEGPSEDAPPLVPKAGAAPPAASHAPAPPAAPPPQAPPVVAPPPMDYGAPAMDYGAPPAMDYGAAAQPGYGGYGYPPPQGAYPPPPQAPPPGYGFAPPPPSVNVQPVQYQSFDYPAAPPNAQNIGLIIDVPLQVTVELGKTKKSIKDVLEFGVGSIIVLDKLAGDLVDVMVNGKLIAKGEVVVIDENYGVRINEIISPDKRV